MLAIPTFSQIRSKLCIRISGIPVVCDVGANVGELHRLRNFAITNSPSK